MKDEHFLGTTTRELASEAKAKLSQLTGTTIACQINETNPTGTCVTAVEVQYGEEIRNGVLHKWVASFSITFLPACPNIAIFHGVCTSPDWRRRGVGRLLHRLRLAIAKAIKVTLVLATTDRDNVVEQAILETEGWRRVKNFDRFNAWMPSRQVGALTLWMKEVQ